MKIPKIEINGPKAEKVGELGCRKWTLTLMRTELKDRYKFVIYLRNNYLGRRQVAYEYYHKERDNNAPKVMFAEWGKTMGIIPAGKDDEEDAEA